MGSNKGMETSIITNLGEGNVMENKLIASNLTESGSVDFLTDSMETIGGNKNPIRLYSIMLIGTNIENYLLVAICNRARWQKHVYTIWNNRAMTTSVLAIVPKDSDEYGYTIKYEIFNNKTGLLYVKLLSW